LFARNRWLLARRSVQLGVLALFLAGPWFGIWWLKGNLASSLFLDAIGLTDPLVLVQSFAAGHKVAAAALIGAVTILLLYVVVGGRAYCSWVCPINIVTDAAFWLRSRLRINASWQPRKSTRVWILVVALAVSALTATIAWELVNPITMLQRGLVFGMGLAWAPVLAVFLFDLAVSRRGWCSTICPVGAFYATVGKASLLRVGAVKRTACTDCGECFRVCPEPHVITPALKPRRADASPVIASGDCTNCGRCIDVCPDDVFRMGTRFAKLAVLLVVACVVAAPVQAKTFVYANQGDTLSMDPHMLNESLLLNFTGNVYESLVGRGRKLELEPELATDWKRTSPTVWRFNLRKGVKFHDGTPFTADDVIFSWQRARGEGSDMKTYVGQIKEIRKIEAHALDIVTGEPFPILPDVLTLWRIVSKSWCEKNNAVRPVDVRKGTENHASNHANGTGPFMLKSRQPGVRTVLVANPGWWGKPEHNVTEAQFLPIANEATRVAALLSGEIDMMEPVPLQDVQRLRNDARLKVMQSPELRTIFLGMDQQRDELIYSSVKDRNPFKDRRVRQAFYRAIDIQAIRSRIMRGAATPTGLMIAPGINGFDPALNQRLPYSPEAAKKLLAEAGYPNGFEVGMNCPNDRYVNDAEICQAVAVMLARIGVKVNLMAETKATFFPKVLSRETSFYLLGWTPGTYDSHNPLFSVLSTPGEGGQGQFNLGAYSNARVDELTRAIGSATDPVKRQAMISEAFKLHAEDIGHLPLHQQMLTWGMKKNIELTQRADNFNYLKWVVIR
jgi:peptide/nickel transport system substrate-binding protein